MPDKIEPALSTADWGYPVVRLEIDHGHAVEVLMADDFQRNVAELPALIALANTALPDDDPRKITREKIATMRLGIDLLPRARDEDFAEYEAARQFADGLASYLPPE